MSTAEVGETFRWYGRCVTEELVRKKSEHNECEISTLEELSLHQEDIEKIEHFQNWCRDLEILLLQSNLIPKIENLWKLKKLKYLNLALNNIERIENLEKLESLEKLDLTLNFVGELTSVQNLKKNYNLKYLYLTGNPCTDYKGYREYVITVLSQLVQLDNVDIERSERILANQDFENYRRSILRDEEKHKARREAEKSDRRCKSSSDDELEMTEDQLKAFWDAPSRNTPEDRIEIAKKARQIKDIDKKRSEKKVKDNPLKLFKSDGRPLNINQPRVPLTMTDNEDSIILDVAVYRFLDTSLINVDLHPKYVTITIKGKVLQVTFAEDILVEKSTCQRSQTTGHLVLQMPKEKPAIKTKKNNSDVKKYEKSITPIHCGYQSKREYLEIGPAPKVDYCNIVENNEREINVRKWQKNEKALEKIPPKDFIDNCEVPPLE